MRVDEPGASRSSSGGIKRVRDGESEEDARPHKSAAFDADPVEVPVDMSAPATATTMGSRKHFRKHEITNIRFVTHPPPHLSSSSNAFSLSPPAAPSASSTRSSGNPISTSSLTLRFMPTN